MQSTVDVICFLASNELSFRGTMESDALSYVREHTDNDLPTQRLPCRTSNILCTDEYVGLSVAVVHRHDIILRFLNVDTHVRCI